MWQCPAFFCWFKYQYLKKFWKIVLDDIRVRCLVYALVYTQYDNYQLQSNLYLVYLIETQISSCSVLPFRTCYIYVCGLKLLKVYI